MDVHETIGVRQSGTGAKPRPPHTEMQGAHMAGNALMLHNRYAPREN